MIKPIRPSPNLITRIPTHLLLILVINQSFVQRDEVVVSSAVPFEGLVAVSEELVEGGDFVGEANAGGEAY